MWAYDFVAKNKIGPVVRHLQKFTKNEKRMKKIHNKILKYDFLFIL